MMKEPKKSKLDTCSIDWNDIKFKPIDVSSSSNEDIDWDKYRDKYKLGVDIVSGKPQYIDVSVMPNSTNTNSANYIDTGILTGRNMFATPKKSLQDKFVVKTKDDKFYFMANKDKSSYSSEAKTFDTVMEALSFADNINQETIVDKI